MSYISSINYIVYLVKSLKMCQNTTQIERAVLHSMGIHIYTSNIVIHRSHVVPTPKKFSSLLYTTIAIFEFNSIKSIVLRLFHVKILFK